MEEEHRKFINLMQSCTACDLSENRTLVVVGDYGPKGGICFVGEAPGANEDKQGRPFVGRSGKLLDEMLEEIGLGRVGVSVLNIAKCRPPNNRNPTKMEAETCTNLWLSRQLEYLDPAFLVTLGGVALNHFVPGRKPTSSKGKLIDTGEYRIYPMLHPAYVLYGGSTKEQYLKDFQDMLAVYRKLREGKVQTDRKSERADSGESQASLDDFV